MSIVAGHVVEKAYALNNPMDLFEGRDKTGYPSFFTLDNPQIEVDAVKKSEDGKYLVVRFHDFAGSSQKVVMDPGFGFGAWMEGDLMEQPIEEPKEGKVEVRLHPYEIKTLLFRL